MLSFTSLYSVQIRYFVLFPVVAENEEPLFIPLLYACCCCIVLFYYYFRISSHFQALKCSLSLSLSWVCGAFFHIYGSLVPCSYTFYYTSSVARAHTAPEDESTKGILLSFVELLVFLWNWETEQQILSSET